MNNLVQSPLFVIFFSWLLTFTGPAQTGNIQFEDASQYFSYGKSLVFQVKVVSEAPIKELFLFIQPDGSETRVEKIIPGETGEVIFEYAIQDNPLRPFSQVEYWYRAVTTNSVEVESRHFYFDYNDNRFEWREIKDDQFVIHWSSGDISFGQTLLNTARAGLKSAQSYLPADLKHPVNIYVYPQSKDLQSALQFTPQSMVAGHASPDLNLILISAPPGPDQRLEIERQIPHELTHILQYHWVGANYTRVPVWLLEGNSSLAELYPNPDYQHVLEQSVKNNSLYPMTTLCTGFPREASGAFLAYAQSASFSRYIFQKYGASGLGGLIKSYSDGLGCEEGAEAALGLTLSEIEKGWQQEVLGMNTAVLALTNLAPYLTLLLLVILPFLVFTFLGRRS